MYLSYEGYNPVKPHCSAYFDSASLTLSNVLADSQHNCGPRHDLRPKRTDTTGKKKSSTFPEQKINSL